jgi:hypothetical protein
LAKVHHSNNLQSPHGAVGWSPPEKADASLGKQQRPIAKRCALADDQRHHLHEQLKQIHLDVLKKQLGMQLRLTTFIVGLAVAGDASRTLARSRG